MTRDLHHSNRARRRTSTAGTAEQAADTFECWDCQERQAKFIVNSVRAYEFFGFEWRLPLFDAELMDFWSRIAVGRAPAPSAVLRIRAPIPATAGGEAQHRPRAHCYERGAR